MRCTDPVLKFSVIKTACLPGKWVGLSLLSVLGCVTEELLLGCGLINDRNTWSQYLGLVLPILYCGHSKALHETLRPAQTHGGGRVVFCFLIDSNFFHD